MEAVVDTVVRWHGGGGGYEGGGGGGGGGGGDMVVMKVTVALLVNSCGLDQGLSWSMCAWILFDVVGRVADEALSGGYENGNRGRRDTGGGD
ncbi:hypothetical protein YC2023_027272 [Brassica napus]